jgi:hypothetical protein
VHALNSTSWWRAQVGKVEGQAPSTSNEWHDEAIRRWGDKVRRRVRGNSLTAGFCTFGHPRVLTPTYNNINAT